MNEITASNYDAHVKEQGLQHQIDAYYEPKRLFDKRRIDIVLRHLDPRPQEMILDVGCGVGTFVFHGAKRGAYCTGLDYSQNSLKMAEELVARFFVSGTTRFVLGQAQRLPFPDKTFDKLTAIDFVEHIDLAEKEMFLSEMFRVLKEGGLAVVFTPNKIREDIGEVYWEVRHFLFGNRVPKNELHYGLIGRAGFEKLLEKHGFSFDFYYYDTTRPYLARLPFFKHFLSLDMLWVIRKKRAL